MVLKFAYEWSFYTKIFKIQIFFFILMSNIGTTGRIPLWLVGTVVGTLALGLVAIFFYGSYVGLGSSLLFKFSSIMLFIFQLALFVLITLSFVLVVGVPVAFASFEGWSKNKSWVLSRTRLWFLLVFIVGVLNSFVV